MKDKVSILGTDYKIIIDNELNRTNADGICEEYTKTIRIRPVEEMLLDNDNQEIKERRFKEVMRHELTHAFFSESGMDGRSADEELVNWMAIQAPKIFKIFTELEVI